MSDQTAFTFESARTTFQTAWSTPGHTCFELPPVDVNAVLRTRYRLEPPLVMTRDQLWDMEMKKAWDPATYIPYVVAQGRSWGLHDLEPDCYRFFRSSDQATWIGERRTQVIEDVSVNRRERRIFFLGRGEITDDRGDLVTAGTAQPLFHVEHAAEGDDANPLNIWKIVLLTEKEDERLQAPFRAMIARGLLPGFIEEYIRRDLGVQLTARSAADGRIG